MGELLITSGFNFEGYSITKYLGYCSGECALGTGFLSSLGAGIADFLGSNSTMYEEKLNRAKNQALDTIKHNAISMGANAIIGIAVNYTAFSADIMGVTVNGTAVKIEKKDVKNVFKSEFSVSKYNSHFPIRPLKLLISTVESQYSLTLCIHNLLKSNNIALKTDIVFTNIFNDQYTLSDVIFTDFTKGNMSLMLESSPTFVNIPTTTLTAIKSIDVFVKKCICNSKEIDVSNTVYEYSSIDQEKLIAEYLLNIRSKVSTREILAYTQRFSAEKSVEMPIDILKIISHYINNEKLYGNMVNSCIKAIEKYYASLT